MINIEERLQTYMISQGVGVREAQLAARRCATAIKSNAAKGFSIGLATGLLTSNPGALIMGIATGAAGAAYTMGFSASCQEVRAASNRLAEDEFFGRPLP